MLTHFSFVRKTYILYAFPSYLVRIFHFDKMPDLSFKLKLYIYVINKGGKIFTKVNSGFKANLA